MAEQRAGPFRASIATIGVVGTGVIGAGWAARFLARGLDVVAFDPGKGAQAALRGAIDNAWPALEQLGVMPGASRDRLRFVSALETLCAQADYVQESAPEREELKTALLAEIDACTPADVLIASSSSGLLPSKIQARCAHPQRVLIAHPFNPVYLLPLVELLGGERTHADALGVASEFLRACAMYPLVVRNEIEGYLSDRLQEALWRENLHLVNDGIADTAELDDAIIYGPGLRWALMGVNKTFHLAGGEAGMRHMLEQFGPALALPWTKLEAPPLSEQLIERMVTGTESQAAGRSVAELARTRDACLVAILRTLARFDVGAGKLLNEDEHARSAAQPQFVSGQAQAKPLELYRCRVQDDWIDYNDHMTDAAYLIAFSAAVEALLRYVGCDPAYHAEHGSFFTAETHTRYRRECKRDEPLVLSCQILGLDEKRLHVFMCMFNDDGQALAATSEQMLLHVDNASGATGPMHTSIFAPLVELAQAHRQLPIPDGVGRAIAMTSARQ